MVQVQTELLMTELMAELQGAELRTELRVAGTLKTELVVTELLKVTEQVATELLTVVMVSVDVGQVVVLVPLSLQ